MSAIAPDPAMAARRDAIEASGWGLRVRVVQPRNFSFWVMVFLMLLGVVEILSRALPGFSAYSPAIIQGLVIFAVFGAIVWWIIQRLDRYSSIPVNVKVWSFLFGGIAAIFAIAVNFNNAMNDLLTKVVGAGFRSDWGAAFGAPLSEELAKGLAVVLMIGIAPKVVRTAFDGFIIGAMAGLGFEVFENVLYVFQSAQSSFGQIEPGFLVAFSRIGFGFFTHWMWTAVVGAGIIYLAGRPEQRPRRALGIGLILSSIALHFLFDAKGAIGGDSDAVGFGLSFGLQLVTIVEFVWVYRMTNRVEQQWMRDVLEPEVTTGIITSDELAALVGTRRHRRRFIKSMGARQERRAAKRVLGAAHELADKIAAARGDETPAVQRARTRIADLRT